MTMSQHLLLWGMVGVLAGGAIAPALAQQPPQLLAQAQLYGTVIANELNVRVGAGTDTAVLYVLPRDVNVRITGQYGDGSDSWYKIVPITPGYPQREGWVYGSYLKVRNTLPSSSYYDTGHQAGQADAAAGRTYDPVAGSRNLSVTDARAYTRGYADGYEAGRPGNTSNLQQYYDDGYAHGRDDAAAGRTYDPVAGSHNLPDNASREYTRGYAAGYDAGRPQ